MISLPTEKTKKVDKINDLTALLYGASKIGKSTFCSRIENAIFLSTEPGLNSLEVFKVDIKTWEDLLEACEMIEKGDHKFKTIIVDTIDNAYELCRDYICRQASKSHESLIGYGVGYALVKKELERVIGKMARMNYGLFLISHAMEIEVDSRTGKYTKIVPSIPDTKSIGGKKIIEGIVDLILYCDIKIVKNDDGTNKSVRVIKTKSSLEYTAGDRTGYFPEEILLSYYEFEKEFNKSVKEKK